MDRTGGLYRLALDDGRLLWQSGFEKRKETVWTTGAAVVGPNGLVYCASNDEQGGIIHAYRLSDGSRVWLNYVGLDANQAVAVGQLAGAEGLAEGLVVVVGVGTNPNFPLLKHFEMFSPFALAFAALGWVLAHLCTRYCCHQREGPYPLLLRFFPELGVLCIVGRCFSFPRFAGGSMAQVIGINGAKFVFAFIWSVRVVFSCVRWRWRVLLSGLLACCFIALAPYLHYLSIWAQGQPTWFWHTEPYQTALLVLDAETGVERWRYEPPRWGRHACAGDEELYFRRRRNDHPSRDDVCMPDSWGQATIDAAGTAFVGMMDGRMYAVRDIDGDGRIDDAPEKDEVTLYDFGTAFQGSPAIARSFLAAAPCGGGLWVWRW